MSHQDALRRQPDRLRMLTFRRKGTDSVHRLFWRSRLSRTSTGKSHWWVSLHVRSFLIVVLTLPVNSSSAVHTYESRKRSTNTDITSDEMGARLSGATARLSRTVRMAGFRVHSVCGRFGQEGQKHRGSILDAVSTSTRWYRASVGFRRSGSVSCTPQPREDDDRIVTSLSDRRIRR